MKIRPAFAYATIAMVVFAGCSSESGNDNEATAASVPASTSGLSPTAATSTGDGDERVYEIVRDGRTLVGRCRGTAAEGSATVILEPGMGNRAAQLSPIVGKLPAGLRVCSYDRAGIGGSDPPVGDRTFTDLVDDLAAFAEEADVAPPVVLVGQSLGASIVYRYAQTHPDTVTGFVAMNPVVPCTEWIERVTPVETPEELQTLEIDFCEGANDEGVDLYETDLMVDEPMPDSLSYVVMFAEDCSDDFCDRVIPLLADYTEELTRHGAGGTFVEVSGAGHEIFVAHLDEVVTEVLRVLPS
jgi:pimeloyl-ACP methyl ester carboxylesterase